MVLFWTQKGGISSKTVGPDYSLRLNDSSILEGSHVFTTFENRCGLKLESDPDFQWSVGTVIRVFNKKRVPRLGKKDPCSHTLRMYNAPTLDLTAWGPTQGEMSEHVRHALHGSAPVVLVAAGSGIGYVIDALQWSILYAPQCDLTVLFTTRSESLFVYIKHLISEFVSDCKSNTRVVLALTCYSKGKDVEQDPSHGPISTIYGRLSIETEIKKGFVVFCQGGASLKNRVSAACRKQHARFFGGLGGS